MDRHNPSSVFQPQLLLRHRWSHFNAVSFQAGGSQVDMEGKPKSESGNHRAARAEDNNRVPHYCNMAQRWKGFVAFAIQILSPCWQPSPRNKALHLLTCTINSSVNRFIYLSILVVGGLPWGGLIWGKDSLQYIERPGGSLCSIKLITENSLVPDCYHNNQGTFCGCYIESCFSGTDQFLWAILIS